MPIPEELNPNKVELVGYFKTTCGRNGKPHLMIVKHFKVMSNGRMCVVDASRTRIYINATFGSQGFTLTRSTKKVYEKAYHKVIKLFNV